MCGVEAAPPATRAVRVSGVLSVRTTHSGDDLAQHFGYPLRTHLNSLWRLRFALVDACVGSKSSQKRPFILCVDSGFFCVCLAALVTSW